MEEQKELLPNINGVYHSFARPIGRDLKVTLQTMRAIWLPLETRAPLAVSLLIKVSLMFVNMTGVTSGLIDKFDREIIRDYGEYDKNITLEHRAT